MRYHLTKELTAYRYVFDSKNYKRIATILTTCFLIFLFFVAIAPWRQTVTGVGQVVAWEPGLREQTVESPISGRLASLYVEEGQAVREGEPLVQLSNNDPAYLERLLLQQTFLREQVLNSERRVTLLESAVSSLENEASSAELGIQARLQSLRRRVRAQGQVVQRTQAELDTATIQQTRQRELWQQGLASARERELAELSVRQKSHALEIARQTMGSLNHDVEVLEAELQRTVSSYDARLQSAQASLESTRAELAGRRASLVRLRSTIATQRTQTVLAPTDGMIVRILVRGAGQQVSQGTELIRFAPASDVRAVELQIDGFNAPLISPGRHVRLQFEGWPAIQFSGWPSVAVGTFGGRVAFVDALDNGNGNFRVLIVADESEQEWPDARYLRQGVRTNGWILLEEVTVGFEIWRQLNDFPPTVSHTEEDEQ